MSPARPIAALVALVFALVGVSGCGSSSSDKQDLSGLPASKLVAKAQKKLQTEPNLRVHGGISEQGQTISLDFSYLRKEAAHGTFSIGGADIELLKKGKQTWFKPSDAFWKAQLGAKAKVVIDKVKGRWIVADPSNPQLASLLQLSSRDFLKGQILSEKAKHEAKKVGKRKIHGTQTIGVKAKDGTLYVSTTDARPVEITGGNSSSSGKMDFEYSKVAIPAAPSKSQQVDLSSLG